ncbi:MAG: hypothetical protein QM520_04675 [Gammaproteobacteria bacterium]|nr:hypothetical protein [Gammaproteobacteria bacterium]
MTLTCMIFLEMKTTTLPASRPNDKVRSALRLSMQCHWLYSKTLVTKLARRATVLNFFWLMLIGLASMSDAFGQSIKHSSPLLPANTKIQTTPIPQPAAHNYVVALVDNYPITNFDLKVRHTLEKIFNPQLQELDENWLTQLLNLVIDDQIQLSIARELRLDQSIAFDDIDAKLQELAQTVHLGTDDFIRKWQSQNLHLELLQQQITHQIILQKLRNQVLSTRINISPKEIHDFLSTTLASSTQVNALLIQIPLAENTSPVNENSASQNAKYIRDLLIQGTNLTDIGRLSQFPIVVKEWGLIPLDQYPEVFVEPLRGKKDSEVLGPIRTGAGFNVLKILKVETGENPNAKELALKKLEQDKFYTEYFLWSEELRAKAQIEQRAKVSLN